MDSLEEKVASGKMRFEQTASLLDDIYAGKSAAHLRGTYGVNIRRNWAIKNRAANAAKILENCDPLALRKLQGKQQEFRDKYNTEYLTRNRIVDYQTVNERIETTTNYVTQKIEERDQVLKNYAARLAEKAKPDISARRELPPVRRPSRVRRWMGVAAAGLFATIGLAVDAQPTPTVYEATVVKPRYSMVSAIAPSESDTISISTREGEEGQAYDELVGRLAKEFDTRQGYSILPGTDVVVLKEGVRSIDATPGVRALAVTARGTIVPTMTDQGLCANQILEPVKATLEEVVFTCVEPTDIRTSRITSMFFTHPRVEGTDI